MPTTQQWPQLVSSAQTLPHLDGHHQRPVAHFRASEERAPHFAPVPSLSLPQAAAELQAAQQAGFQASRALPQSQLHPTLLGQAQGAVLPFPLPRDPWLLPGAMAPPRGIPVPQPGSAVPFRPVSGTAALPMRNQPPASFSPPG